MPRKITPPKISFRRSFPTEITRAGLNIAWSGGRDSTVCLNMAIEATGDPQLINPFYMALIPGMDYTAFWRDFAWRRWQVRVREYQHWALSWFFRRGTFRLYADPTFPRVLLGDVQETIRRDSGFDWICYGYKSIDSLQRRGMMNSWENCISRKRKIFAPLKVWNNTMVDEYLQKKKLGLLLEDSHRTMGIDMSPRCMHWLREHWPADYQRMIRVFPLAVAQADRWPEIEERLRRTKRLSRGSKPSAFKGDGTFPDALVNADWQPDSQLEDLPFGNSIDNQVMRREDEDGTIENDIDG